MYSLHANASHLGEMWAFCTRMHKKLDFYRHVVILDCKGGGLAKALLAKALLRRTINVGI